jgi:hypothetical protein
VKDKPRSGRPCTVITPRNEEHLNQLIRANRRITTRKLPTELILASMRWERWWLFKSVVVFMEINRMYYFRSDPLIFKNYIIKGTTFEKKSYLGQSGFFIFSTTFV